MTEDQEPREVSEADMDAALNALFGRAAPAGLRGDRLAAFREAGFDEDLAEHGARLLESGRFFGFEDVATTLSLSPSTWAGRQMVTPERIRAAAQRLSERGDGVTLAEALKDKPAPADGRSFSEKLRAEPRSRW